MVELVPLNVCPFNINTISLLIMHLLQNSPDNKGISNSYTMVCPPVREDNPRALASGLSPYRRTHHDIQQNFSGSNTHGSLTTAVSNSFLSP